MSNNKKNKTENMVKVLVSLPENVHKTLKVEAIMRKNGNQKKMNLQAVLIERLERDIRTYPLSVAI